MASILEIVERNEPFVSLSAPPKLKIGALAVCARVDLGERVPVSERYRVTCPTAKSKIGDVVARGGRGARGAWRAGGVAPGGVAGGGAAGTWWVRVLVCDCGARVTFSAR
ncbi:hypothetical protein GCM10012284_14460 [Mangrovihabitans endophyticus]|uniref:Uncharacterized protein n=1 Tax=Mangrovihabitans endophyticus TaxID=1751298 RepID=A0A8J3BYQ3_9ACTN|nr:hypothetical protein GCM10012284_14460 [Mangrovihabitans endophyticus]